MRFRWLSNYLTNETVIKEKVEFSTTSLFNTVSYVFTGWDNGSVIVVSDNLFSDMFMHASAIGFYQWWYAQPVDITIGDCSVSKGDFIQYAGIYFIRESVADELVNIIAEEFEIKETPSSQMFRPSPIRWDWELVSRKQHQFESYNVFKRVWLAITKQVIF